MNCFKHQQEAAIGSCKVCQKGLCAICATDLEHSLACKDNHESDAEALNDLIFNNIKSQKENSNIISKESIVNPLFYFVLGIIFIFYKELSFEMVTGSVFIIFSVIYYFIRNPKLGKSET